MSLEERLRKMYLDIEDIINHRRCEIGYDDEDDTIIIMLEDLQDELKVLME